MRPITTSQLCDTINSEHFTSNIIGFQQTLARSTIGYIMLNIAYNKTVIDEPLNQAKSLARSFSWAKEAEIVQ